MQGSLSLFDGGLIKRTKNRRMDAHFPFGNTSTIDWSSIIVVGLGLLLPGLLSAVVDRWWTRREYAQQQAARQTGEVFAIPPMLRSPTLFAMFALSAISLVMLIAALNGPQPGVTMTTGVGLCLLFGPLVIGGLMFLLHNTGMVILTAEGVLLRRPGHKRFLRYDEIVAVNSQSQLLAPGIVIRGRGRVLRIPRTLENRPHFYNVLLQRVAPGVRDAALGKTTAATKEGPVYTLTVSHRVWALYITGTVLFILIYLGIGLMGIWSGLARGVIPPFNTLWVRNALLFFLMVSLIFVPALIVVLHSLLTKYGPFKIAQPVAWQFYQQRICYRLPRSHWQERPASDLRHILLYPRVHQVRAQGIEQPVTLYMLILEFNDGAQLVIDQERATQFGQTPERLWAMLMELYEAK